jgi:response regulator of citrate/malate metabolism
MAKQNNSIKSNILVLLLQKPFGLTIEDVSQELKINRTTASKYLAIMDATQEILVREVGKAKLHYPKMKSLEGLIK